ncbi:inositol monophosphatase family protein [Aestuariivirga litoralis]|uniref:inositol monophosphatase family protein n=1 Tax=Aestuariivirga litoralis TaxID=2650924 RepID=UPI0018C53609|nr:inositol monophosphatase family protein [Aestuariivirga litoralis]MBG1232450.1 inositol monophosphatase [Aestuariivirga litoralis]
MATTPIMTVMIAAVRKAARNVQRDFGEVSSLQVSVKGPADFVTNSDKKAEKVLREELGKARPTYGFLGEEEAETKGSDPDHRFIIDPIDGTFNFMHALPFFALTIALERKGEIIAGVTYNPIHDELFHAEKGSGAFVNNKRMRVGARRELSESLLFCGLPNRAAKTHDLQRKEMALMQTKTAGIRALGSTALDLAYTAMGRLDGGWTHGLKPWDMAAGLLFVKESGGFVAGLGGEDNPLHTGGYMCGNADLLPQIKAALAEAKTL